MKAKTQEDGRRLTDDASPQRKLQRQVVQIAINPSRRDSYTAVYALCNDGTIWSSHYEGEWEGGHPEHPDSDWSNWEHLPAIPQEEPPRGFDWDE